MSSLPIRSGAQKGGPAFNEPKQAFSPVTKFRRRRRRLQSSSGAYNSRHKHLKYQ
jgi:hypothetical protein